jgi:RHS repeat-associated protein
MRKTLGRVEGGQDRSAQCFGRVLGGKSLTETRNSITDTYSCEANSGVTGNTARLDVVNLGIGGTRDYTFDAGGFLDLVDLGANQVDFTFDAAGQLALIERPAASETLTLRYDGRGFLCDASDTVSGGYTKPTYSSDGVVMSLERLPDSAGTTEIHNVLYFAGIPVVLWTKVGTAASTRQYLAHDHLGTPIFAFSTAGTALWNGGLGPFGKDWQEGTANDMLGKGIFLRFPGQWDDAIFTNASLGADVYYNVHRWYEPHGGRYSRPDPLGLPGTRGRPGERMREGRDINLFSYAFQNPAKFADPLGLAVQTYGCTAAQDAKIQRAAGQADAASQSCLPCADREPFRRKIRSQGTPQEVVFECVSWTINPNSGDSVCGVAQLRRGRVLLTLDGLDELPGCPCLQALILHEVVHLIGYDESQAFDSERRCFSCGG